MIYFHGWEKGPPECYYDALPNGRAAVGMAGLGVLSSIRNVSSHIPRGCSSQGNALAPICRLEPQYLNLIWKMCKSPEDTVIK